MIEYSLEEAKRVWLIGDTHFDHTNIIRYCNRPFASTEEMNNCILRNWRKTIKPKDVVYFLGDMTFGRGSRKPRWWAAQLSGKIIWIKGSHDHGIRPSSIVEGIEKVALNCYITCNGIEFMLVHDPFDAILNAWRGWIIHAHNHDNRPHIDNRFGHKRISVSVEVINYKPISLATIVREIGGTK